MQFAICWEGERRVANCGLYIIFCTKRVKKKIKREKEKEKEKTLIILSSLFVLLYFLFLSCVFCFLSRSVSFGFAPLAPKVVNSIVQWFCG